LPAVPPIGFGLGTVDQVLPFQCSISVRSVLLRGVVVKPTAQPSVRLRSTTLRMVGLRPAGDGIVAAVHLVPFQCSPNSVLVMPRILLPTARALLAAGAETATRLSSTTPFCSGLTPGLGVGTMWKMDSGVPVTDGPGVATSAAP
jgi:hypothetical protein